MKNLFQTKSLLFFLVLTAFGQSSCKVGSTAPSAEAINSINLKRGDVILCGNEDQTFGDVNFETSCPGVAKDHFTRAVAMLHSFEYDESEKVFAKAIDAAPDCAMAYWGVAMCNYHPLWTPPSEAELEKGLQALTVAKTITNVTEREAAWINALFAFYNDYKNKDHRTRSLAYEAGMEKLYSVYPEDKEAAIFYALALDGAADPADTSFVKQKKAGEILTALNPGQPDHPGLIHYMIHSYDSPALANLALPAARKYASIAPSSAHAQHMPSHIFTRVGSWDESIKSNLVSKDAALCYAEGSGIKGHWDEELHALDYLMYGYLQQGDTKSAKEELDYLQTIDLVFPAQFKEAYAFAAMPARFYLENRMWNEAANLEAHPSGFPWQKFPWQFAITHFTRALGAVHTNQLADARTELVVLNTFRDSLVSKKDTYKANQVHIQIKATEGWILWKEGKKNEALASMQESANMENLTQKHPVTPGEVLPAQELLGDMLMEMNKPKEALEAYERDLKKHPNRFNGLYGAALAAEKAGQHDKAKTYYQQLIDIAKTEGPVRSEIEKAKAFIASGAEL
ncbi:MAG: tetratricopeptide repeat protein [Bacteroidota bacterium]|nr:tetratricopeptide repeat protein [Bacteroidota bacterium]